MRLFKFLPALIFSILFHGFWAWGLWAFRGEPARLAALPHFHFVDLQNNSWLSQNSRPQISQSRISRKQPNAVAKTAATAPTNTVTNSIEQMARATLPVHGEVKRAFIKDTFFNCRRISGASAGVLQNSITKMDAASSDPDGIIQIRNKIRSYLQYPLSLRRRKISGQVLVQFSLNRSGEVKYLKLIQSSGFMELDKLAFQAISDAAPFLSNQKKPSMGRQVFNLPIDFKLNP